MSKKNSVAKKPVKAATKTLKSAKAASLALDQAVALDAEGQVLLTAAIEEAKTQAQAAAEKADALLAADAAQESKDKEVAEVDSAEVASDKVLSRVEPIDRGGESLLMAAAKGEAQDDDKAAGEWPSFFPLLAGLGALAALGGGGGSGVQHPDGYQGVVFDTPVKNAIVFRDSNGDGIWDATESIAVTDQNGNYTGLSGTGSIVATSLDRLVGRDALGTLTHYKITDSIVINGQTITGFATDVGADETLGTADDFVWSGTYVSAAALQEGSVKVYITAVSSLVTAYLAEKGQTAATPAQVDEAIRELKSIFVYDTSTGMAGAGSDIQFLTSELNGQVTKIMGDAIARAEKDGTDVQQAIKDALTALAKAADKAGAGENIDLTQVEDLQSILFAQDDADAGLVKAEALALQTGKTGPAVYSVWFDEEGTHVTQVEVTQDTLGYDTPVTTGVFSADARPVGNVTVLSNADSSEVGLTVQPKDGQNDFEFQGARLLVRAVGDGSSSGLDVQDATGQVTSVSVQATGGRAYTNETQAIVLNGLILSDAAAGLEVGTVIDLTIDGEKLSYTVVEGDLTDANVVAKILASFQEQAAAKSIVVRIAMDAEQDQLTFVWADEKSHEPLTVAINELPISLDIFHSEGGLPVDATADLNLNLTGDITDNIEVSASGLNADADARIHGEVDIDGDIDVTASSADAYAEANLTGTMSLAGDMHVSASAQDAYAAANLNGEDGISTVLTGSDITLAATAADAQARAILGHVSGQMDQVSVTGQGDDAAAEVDVTAEADKTLTVNTVTLRADSSLSGGSGADADAYFRGETGELGAQRGWEALNAESSDHGTVRITGDIGVTAVGESDWAYLGVNEGGNDQGYTVLAGGDIRLSATGSNASADAFIRNAAGTAGDLEITAGGTSAVQGFDLQNYFRPVGGVVTLAAGDVISFTVGEEEALTYTVTAADARNAQGINALLENVVNSFNTQANDQALGVSFRSTEVDPNSPFSKGLFATWGSVRSEAPAAIKLNGNAINNEAYAFFKDGTVESHAQLDLQTENTGVTAQSLSVTASAQNAVADADILGDVGIEGHMRVTASERFADAQIHINETGHGSTVLGGGAVGVTASGEQSDAQAHVHHASGEVAAISVLASNTLASADLALDTEGQGVTAASLSVLASGQSASADADINGNVSITGDLGVTASAAVSTAYAHVNDGGDDSTVLGGGDISVTAGGALSDAELHIDNASGTSGAVSVTASSAQADATLNVNTSAELSAESLTVLASAQSADAHANLGGDVAIQGDLSITASAAEAIAHAHLNDEDDGSTVLGGGDITLTASGALSDAAVYIDNASGTAGAVSLTASSVDADAALSVNISGELSAQSLTVLASAQSADADVTLGGDVTLEGDLSVTASATQAIAHAHLNDDSDGSTALDGGDLALTASGTSSSAEVYIAHASGTLGEVTLDSTGSDAEAYLEVAAQADKTLTVGSIAIHADSRAVQGSDAWADAYFRGETGKVAEQDRWTELNEVSTDHGTVQLQGDISVSAAGQADWVYLGVNDGGYESQNTDRGYTVLAQTGDDENITIQASGTDASAEVYLYNATGTAGNISVTASGSHEVQGFDFLYHFRPVDAEKQLLEVGKVFSVQVGETTYSYEVTFADYRKAASINDLLTKIIAQFNDEAQTLGQGITFSNSYDGQGSSFDKGLFVTWDSVRDETAVSVTYDAKAVLDQDVYFTKDGTVGSTASFDLQTEFTGVTAENLTVTASAENATADTFIHGDVTLNGDIRVTASEVSADAQALINEEGDGQTVLGSEGQPSQLTVTASHDGASAELDVGNVSGFVDSIRVDAGGVDSQAHLHLQESTEEGKTLNITGEMHVVANEVSSDALVSITATQAALDDITVSANSQDAQATLTLDVENTISGDNLHVQADGANARADADLNAELVSLRGDIDVQAAGRKAWANADLDVASVLGTPEHGTHMNVEANGEDSDAVLNIAQASGFVDGINVSSDGYSANAFFELSDDATQGTVLDIDGAINVQAEGYSASAYANVSATQAHLSDITVSATDGYAHADFMLRTETDLHADHVTALASGDWAGANVALEGTVAITGDVHVSSDGDLARAYVWVNSNDVGTATLGTTVEGVDVGSNITVEANSHGQDGIFFATSSLASISGAQGTVGSLDVSASGDFSTTAVARVEGNITVQGDITVQAKDLENYGAVALNAPLSLVADAANPDGIHFEGSNITVTASGEDSDAEAAIGNASGTLGDISLTADGINADASFDLSIKSELTVDSLSVLAGAQSADADADISGDVSITADVSVTASSEDATAHAHINDGGDARTVLGGGDITLSASGTQSGAELHIDNASGSTGAITVTGDGVEAMASFDLSISGDLTADSVTVSADAQSADAFVNVNGHVAITGDIDVTGNGQDTNAVVAINAEGGAINEAGGMSTLGQSVEGGDAVGSNIHVDALGKDASAGVYIVDAQGTVGSWDTSASGDGASAQSWILGDITVQGDFSVTADQTEARAYAANAPMFAPFSGEDPSYGTVHFEDSDITVTSKGESSDAYAFIMNATGRIDDIEVTASGQSADAFTWLLPTDAISVDIHTITVTASGMSSNVFALMAGEINISGDTTVSASNVLSDAQVGICGDVVIDGNLLVTASSQEANANAYMGGSLDVTGDISLVASGMSSDAQVGICGDVVIDGNINVLASSQDANADVGIGQNLDFTGNISVDASGTCADAQVHLMGSVDIAGDLSVTASGQSADALIEISGDVTLSGDIDVLASGLSADAVIDLDGDISLTGDLNVTARAAGSTAHGTLADQVNLVGDIHITSSGTSAEAGVDMMGSLDIEGNVNVTASGNSADAHFEVSGDLVMVGDIHVTSSGDASMAIAEISNDLTLTGDIHVLSSGEDAMAFADIRGEANLVGDLLVEATGSAADAYAFLSGDIAMSGDMDVVAASDDSYAEAMFEGSVDITGDMAFTASAESAYTYAEFNNEDSGRTVLDVGSLDITSSGTESSAEVFVDNASGTVDHVHVQATGDSADAYLEIAVEVEKTLTFDTLTVEANSDASTSGDAAIAEAYVFGKTGDIPVQERWKLLDTESTDHGTVEINGDINVTAAGLNDEAYLGVNDSGPNGSTSDNGYTLLNGGNVTLAATGTSSDVETYIHNAKGTLADVSVTAGGSHEVQGFDFLYYFRPVADVNQTLVKGNYFSVEVGGQTYSYKVEDVDYRNTANINALLEKIVVKFNVDAQANQQDITFSSTYSGPGSSFDKGLFVTWDSVRDETEAVIAYGNSSVVNINDVIGGDKDLYFIQNGTVSSDAYLDLHTENTGVTADSLAVTASAQSAVARTDIIGDVAILGDISVTASELSADADADINGEDSDTTTTLGREIEGEVIGSVIDVIASGQAANAQAEIGNASGTVGDVRVHATGSLLDPEGDDYFISEARLDLELNGTITGSLDVLASQESAETNASIYGNVVIQDDISVTASGLSADAAAEINRYGENSTTLAGGDITITASGVSSDANGYIYHASGDAGQVTVAATADDAYAYLDVLVETSEDLSLSGVSISATSTDAYAEMYVYGENEASTVTVTGDIDISATSQDTEARLYLVEEDSRTGEVVLGGGEISLSTTGYDSEAHAHIYNASGTVGDVNLLNNAAETYTHLELEAAPGHDLTLASLTLLNQSGAGSEVEAEVWTSSADAHVFITGDISVTAQGTETLAWVDLNDKSSGDSDVYAETLNDGTITLGQTTGNDETVGSNISVLAVGDSSDADAYIYNTNGTAGDVTVRAGGTGEIQYVSPVALWFLGTTGITEDTPLSIIVDGVELSVSGDEDSLDNLNAQALAKNLGVTFSSADNSDLGGAGSFDYLKVTWSDALAHEPIAFKINDVVYSADTLPDVTTVPGFENLSWPKDLPIFWRGKSGTDSNAYLDLEINGTIAGDNLIEATGISSEAYAVIEGQVTLQGDVTVLASGSSADAQVDYNGYDTGTTTMVGGDVKVTSSGAMASADAYIYNALGSVDALTVEATGVSSEAYASVQAQADQTLSIGSVTVLADSAAGDVAQANAYLRGESGNIDAQERWSLLDPEQIDHGTVEITGNISVSAMGVSDDATLMVNVVDVEGDMEILNGYTVLGGGDITVTAAATNACADALIANARGTAGDIKVSAEGTAEVQGFDFLYYFRGKDGAVSLKRGDEFTCTIGGETLSYVVTSADVSNDRNKSYADEVNALFLKVVSSFNEQAQAKGLDLSFSSEFDGDSLFDKGLFATWNNVQDHAAGEIALNGTKIDPAQLNVDDEFVNAQYFFNQDGTVDSGAFLSLLTENIGVTADSLTVLSSAQSSDAIALISGDVTIVGDITVMASELFAQAHAVVNYEFGDGSLDEAGHTVLGGGDLTVISSGAMACADAVLDNTQGNIDALRVEATGVFGAAVAAVSVDADHTLSMGSVTVLADSAADEPSAAMAYLFGESGDIDEQDRWSLLDPEQVDHGTVEIVGDISVSAMGVNDEALLVVNAYGEDSALLRMELPTFNGYTVLGGGDISVTAGGTHACADALIANARGTAGDITVSAEGTPEVQGFDFLYYFRGKEGAVTLKRGDEFTCTIGDETLSYTVSSTDVVVRGPLSYAEEVNALLLKVVSSFNAQAEEKGLDLSFSSDFEGDSLFDKGLFATWNNVQDHAAGTLQFNSSDINPLAVNGADELINAQYFFNQDGTVDNSAYLDLKTESTGVTADSLTVSASAQSGDAIASITGDVTILGDITVTASELYSEARAWVNGQPMFFTPVEVAGNTVLGGGDITVTASGSPAENQAVDGEYNYFASMAEANIGNATGTVGDITVRSSGAPVFSEDINRLSGVNEVQTFNYSFDSDFAAWASSNDSGTTTWTLTVDGQDFTFTGGPVELQNAIVGWNTAASDDGFSFDFSSNELNITWASDDFTDHELASISAEGSVTTGAEWVNVELTTEEQQTFFVDNFLSAESSLTGEDTRTWTLEIGGESYDITSSSDFDFSKDVLEVWDNSIDGVTIEFIDSSDNTQDRFIVSFESNDDIHHSDISFKVANSSGDTEDIISGMSDDKAQVFDSTDIGVMVEALGDENLTGDTTWTLHVGGEDYSVDVDASSVNWASADDIRDLIFDVVGSWDTGLTSTSFDIEFVNSTDSSSDYFAITWGSSDSVELASITVDGVDVSGIAQKINFGVIPQFTTQDGVAGTGSNGSAEIQKFYVEDFESWMSYDGTDDVKHIWTVTVAGHTYTADIGSFDCEDVSVDMAKIIAGWNECDDGDYDVKFALSSSGDYFTITVSADDNGTVNISSDDIYANHDLASFDVERTVTRSASWDVKGEDYEMTDGAGNRVICGHEYIPSIAALDLQLDGTISGDIVVEATHVASVAEAMIEGDLQLQGDIHLTASGVDSAAYLGMNTYDDSNDIVFSNDITVTATGEGAEADLVLNGLVGKVNSLHVEAAAQDSQVNVSLVFESDTKLNQFGSVNTVTIDADHGAVANVTLDQSMKGALSEDNGLIGFTPANTGTVSVTGEGQVGLTYYVDRFTVTGKSIDLTGMNEDSVGGVPSQNLWGYADIDLVGKLVNGKAHGPQLTSSNVLFPKMINIDGFNVERDSINLRQESTVLGSDEVALDTQFSSDTSYYDVCGDTTTISLLENSAVYYEAVDDLLADALEYFAANRAEDSETAGYFYREVEFDFGRGDVEEIETRSFMVYDFDARNAGVSGIITFGSTTGVTERNVTQRYSILNGSEDVTLSGFHSIESLTVTSDADGSNDVSYDLATSADVMISDISVTAFEFLPTISGDATLWISGSDDDKDDSTLQLRQSDIFVAADREGASAGLFIEEAWGTVSSLTLHATLGGSVSADVAAVSYLVGEDSQDAYFDHGLHVRDVTVIADGDLSNAAVRIDMIGFFASNDADMENFAAHLDSMDMTVDGFVDTLSLQALGFGSSVDVWINQADHGGVVHVSGSSLSPEHDDCECHETYGDNVVNLAYSFGTADRIVIDNEGRDALIMGSDDSISFNFLYVGQDKDMTRTDAVKAMVTIEGWTSNDTVSLSGEDGTDDNFQYWDGGDELFVDEGGMEILLTGARQALVNSEYFFAAMDGNGYLFHDGDADGYTMIIEFLGVTNFDYTKIVGGGTPG